MGGVGRARENSNSVWALRPSPGRGACFGALVMVGRGIGLGLGRGAGRVTTGMRDLDGENSALWRGGAWRRVAGGPGLHTHCTGEEHGARR